jgi:hypothetical protein
MPQKSAICVKVRAVFSMSHTAVALGINGVGMSFHFQGRYAAGSLFLGPQRGGSLSGPQRGGSLSGQPRGRRIDRTGSAAGAAIIGI